MTPYDRYLAHHGVKGQKWGVIRTPEQLGHDRKAEKEKKEKISAERLKAKQEKVKSITDEVQKKNIVAKRDISELSNDELRIKVERLRLENDYRNLLPKHEKKVSEGRKYATDILKTIGKTALTTVGTGIAIYAAKEVLVKMAGQDKAKEMMGYAGKTVKKD